MTSISGSDSGATGEFLSELHEAAVEYARAGFPVFPCIAGSKVPATEHGFRDATTDEARIKAWWRECPDYNIGTEPGRADLCVIDIEADGLAQLADFCGEHGELPRTFMNTTPRGGQHLFFAGHTPSLVRPFKGFAIDTRGDGGYVLLPPSRTADGEYTTPDVSSGIAELPGWIAERLATRKCDAQAAPDGLIYDLPENITRAKLWLATHPAPVQGERNDKTFKAACKLKDLGCSPQTVLDMLLEWAPLADDFTAEEVEGRVVSAFENGQNEPGNDAVLPSAEAFKNIVAGAKSSASRLVVRRATDITPKPIEWMWRNRFPRASLSLIAGHGNLGKTTVLLDIAARVTRGDRWPDGDGPATQGSVIYFSGEDSAEHVLLPRFMAPGGDRDRLHFVSAVKREDGEGHRTFDLKADLAKLEELIAELGDVELVIFDPISSYFGNADTWRSSQVRAVLEPVAEMADRRRVTVIGNTHFTKSGKGPANMRILDSVAMSAVARSTYVVVQDDEVDERRLFLPSKWNLTKKPDGLAFTVDEKFVAVGVSGTFVRWGEPVSRSADEALAASEDKDRPQTELDGAVAFLREQLAEGERPVTDVHFEAHQAGIALKTLKRARSRLRIEKFKSKEVDGKWFMRLPDAPGLRAEDI